MSKADEYRSGYIALVGRPNVGKSTLMNRLIGYKVAITSAKPQTTRNKILTVYTDEEAQMIFLDTPGIHEATTALGDFMMQEATSVLNDADVILWLVEPDPFIGEKEERVIRLLEKSLKPVLLIINKADRVSDERIAAVKAAFAEKASFADAYHVSALKGIGTDTLLSEIKKMLPYGPPFYEEDTLTDLPERDIVAEIIREKALRNLKDEVPHGIAVTIERMREREGRDDGLIDIEATIICEKDSHKGIVIGKGGAMLKRIGADARKDIERLLETKVFLKIFVKVRRDWKDNPAMLNGFGYRSGRR